MTLNDLPIPTPRNGKTEWKVRVAALGTYLAALAGSIVLSTTATDYVHALPDWLENIVYPSALAGVTWLSGRAARTKPDYLSPSTVQAVEEYIRTHAPRRSR